MEDITFYESTKLHNKDFTSFASDAELADIEALVKESPLEAYCRKNPDAPECRMFDL